MSKTILFQLLNERAKMPSFGSPFAAAFDLYAALERPRLLQPDGRALIPTGLVVAIPDDTVLLLFSRSGHGFKQGLRLSNCVGVIDPDYRGEVGVAITNDSDRCQEIVPGERIAQGLLLSNERPMFSVSTSDLPTTARGAGGWGHTGRL